MTATGPETPLGSPAPAAPTPVEALAAELEAEAIAPSDSPHKAWRSMLLRDFAELLRERLAPAWDAAITARLGKVVAQAATYKRERDEAREQLADAERDCGEMRPLLASLSRERDEARDEAKQDRITLGSMVSERERLAADNASLRKQLADLRMSLDYGAGQWESNAMPHTMPARSGEYRAVMKDCARDLRHALKANAPDAPDVRAELASLRDAGREMLDHITSGDDYADPVKVARWTQALGDGA